MKCWVRGTAIPGFAFFRPGGSPLNVPHCLHNAHDHRTACWFQNGLASSRIGDETAGRGNQNRHATVRSKPSSWSGKPEQLLLNYMGWRARKFPAAGEMFFLTSPFIELIRSWQLTAGQIGSEDNYRVGDHPGAIAWWLESKCRGRPLPRAARYTH